MEITVRGDRLFFKQEHVEQVAKLINKHLSAFPLYLRKIHEDKPNGTSGINGINGNCWLDFNFRGALKVNDSKIDLERAITDFLDAVRRYLSKTSRLVITNQNGKTSTTSTEFTGMDAAQADTDELGISELSRLTFDALGKQGQHGVKLTPGGDALIELIKNLARDLSYRNHVAFKQTNLAELAQLTQLTQLAELTQLTHLSTPAEQAKQAKSAKAFAIHTPHTLYTSYTVFILATDAKGNPTMLTTNVLASIEQYRSGKHYAVAKQRAQKHGYTQTSSFDENDPAARAISRENCYTLPDKDDPLVVEGTRQH